MAFAKAISGHAPSPKSCMVMAVAGTPMAPPMPGSDIEKLPCSRALALSLSQNAWLVISYRFPKPLL